VVDGDERRIHAPMIRALSRLDHFCP
jgi:hypothetical protein